MGQANKRKLQLQSLESRNLLNAAPIGGDDIYLIGQGDELIMSSLLLNDSDVDGDELWATGWASMIWWMSSSR